MRTTTEWRCRLLCGGMLCMLWPAPSLADYLSDAEMFCDPWTVPTDVYPKSYLEYLADENSVAWLAGDDPVVGAQVLPVIRAGTYEDDYIFSQDDYLHQPNVDYFADLTDGTLTATFLEPGLYHVRLFRDSGLTDIQAVLAQTYIGAQCEESGATKDIGIPDADLFIVSDSEGDDSYEETSAKVLEAEGKKIERAGSVQEAWEKINAADPAPKHVELVGHGNQGYVSLGNGPNPGPSSKVLDSDNAATFRDKIKDKVDHLTFLSCNTGGGVAGASLINTLDDGIDTVQAYDSWVDISADRDANGKITGGTYLTSIKGKNVPGPATISLFCLGGLALLRRRVA
jgi:hypothetical protein